MTSIKKYTENTALPEKLKNYCSIVAALYGGLSVFFLIFRAFAEISGIFGFLPLPSFIMTIAEYFMFGLLGIVIGSFWTLFLCGAAPLVIALITVVAAIIECTKQNNYMPLLNPALWGTLAVLIISSPLAITIVASCF